jgi:phosphohistidine phosphatase
MLVGHQPMLGRIASVLLRGDENDLSFKKGALWWFRTRERDGEPQIVLKSVTSADML